MMKQSRKQQQQQQQQQQLLTPRWLVNKKMCALY
jgi:hypothetical protein